MTIENPNYTNLKKHIKTPSLVIIIILKKKYISKIFYLYPSKRRLSSFYVGNFIIKKNVYLYIKVSQFRVRLHSAFDHEGNGERKTTKR